MTDTTTTRRERLDRAAANARVRRYRLRLAGVLPPLPVCPQCGGQVRAADPLCRRCWRLTDEGRAWNRERMRLARMTATERPAPAREAGQVSHEHHGRSAHMPAQPTRRDQAGRRSAARRRTGWRTSGR